MKSFKQNKREEGKSVHGKTNAMAQSLTDDLVDANNNNNSMKTHSIIKIGIMGLLAILTLVISNCRKDEYTERTNYELLIGEYLEQNPDEFSTFYEVLQKSESLSFIKAYGAYTVFAPTNQAFKDYFASKNKNGVDDFSPEELKDLVRYHTILDTIASTLFVDGKLQSPTMYGQYLTSRVSYIDNEATYLINKYATIDMKDKRLLNGILFSVESVLDPVTKTISNLIGENPEYSIFYNAMVETGYVDSLNIAVEKGDQDPRWFTAIVVPNSAYLKDGIKSYDDLKAKYSDTGDPSNPADSLFLYVAYHCLDKQLKYVADLQEKPSHLTMAPLEVITVKTRDAQVFINEDFFNGEIEEGYPLNLELSDNTANNGVFHIMDNDFNIKLRFPFPVYWEVTDQLEIRKMPGIYGRQSVELEPGQLADITWPEGSSIWYVVGTLNSPYPFVLGDYLEVYLRPEVVPWIEFTTPILVKGEYKMWTCTRNVYPSSGRRNPIFFAYFNDEVLPVIIDTNITLSRDVSEEEYELQGLKWYSFWPATDSTAYRYVDGSGSGRFTSQLAGTIKVETTGQHKIRFVGISAYAGQKLWLDQIHFIPTDMDQIWPRSNVEDNSRVEKAGLPPMVIPE